MFKIKFAVLVIIALSLRLDLFSSCRYNGPIDQETPYEVDTINTKHFAGSYGLNIVNFRDFATSPLFYSGAGVFLTIGSVISRKQIEYEYHLKFSTYSTSSMSPQVGNYRMFTSSAGGTIEGQLTLLSKNEKFKFNRHQILFGATTLLTSSIRFNPSLGNSALGVDNFINLMASMRIVSDVSLRHEQVIKFLFHTIRKKPQKRQLIFQANVGLINFNHRPGYAYLYEGPIHSKETSILSWKFDNYNWMVNGYRIQTGLTYKRYFRYGNARSISYIWEVFNAPGKIEPFQMAIHQLRFTLFFNR